MKGKNNKKKTKVAFVALGCPKNTVDGEKMLADIVTSDLLLTDRMDRADIVIINTCGFIEAARDEAFGEINAAAKLKKRGKVKKIVVAGCMAQMYGDELFKLAPAVDAVVGLSARDKLAEIIKEVSNANSRQTHVDDQNTMIHSDSGRLLITPSHYAYLRISEGCSRKCAFCTIPDIRGPFRSKSIDMVLAEASELAQSGVKEIVLIAQDTSNYGKDIGLKNGLVQLLERLEQVNGIQWIRIMYLYPSNVTDELIEKIATSDKILNYVDMPIQHINDDILKAMRRSDTHKNTETVIEKLRAKIPDIVLRTTVIAGFPGETDQQFAELLDFIEQAKFDMLGCFAYSAEKGTPAAEMEGQLDADTKNQRAQQVMLTQQKIAFDKAKQMIGKKIQVIVDQAGDKGFASGRYYGQAPDIDSLTLIENFKSKPSDIINAEVIDTEDYDLIVKEV